MSISGAINALPALGYGISTTWGKNYDIIRQKHDHIHKPEAEETKKRFTFIILIDNFDDSFNLSVVLVPSKVINFE